ncbi:MAG TPA: Uma2 family endonuclease [Thermoanaerobaculia bacterium]|nr:Uma2 family endonuclease [Thermoanaerobaculia bacterium]
MAEPARKLPDPWDAETEDGLIVPLLHRWVQGPDGRFELLVRPATREDILYPQLEDKILQGEPHAVTRGELASLLRRRFQPESLVLEDVCIRDLGPGLPAPSPDITIVLKATPGDRSSFSVAEEGVRPDLIIEIVSPSTAEIRKTDEEDKVRVYSQAGIPEYVLLYLPRPQRGGPIRPLGYRFDSQGQYCPIELDEQGRIFSETTRLWFAPGERIQVIDDRTGQRILYADEEEAQRKAAEAENARLREELERLKRKLES